MAGRGGSARRSRRRRGRGRCRRAGRRPRRSRAGAWGPPPAAAARSSPAPPPSPPCRGRGCRRSRGRRPRPRRPPGPIPAAGPRGSRPGRSRRPPGARGPCSPCQARQRSSQRWVRSVERAVYSRSAWKGVHSSKTRAMSEPSCACTLIETSGEMNSSAPSRGEWNRAPSSLISTLEPWSPERPAALDLVGDAAVGEREDLEAAGVGDQRPLPVHEAVQPAGGGDPLRPGRDEQVVGVAEDQLVAEPGDLGRLQPPHRPLRRQRDEGRRLDRPVGGVDDARAGGCRRGPRSRTGACSRLFLISTIGELVRL